MTECVASNVVVVEGEGEDEVVVEEDDIVVQGRVVSHARASTRENAGLQVGC